MDASEMPRRETPERGDGAARHLPRHRRGHEHGAHGAGECEAHGALSPTGPRRPKALVEDAAAFSGSYSSGMLLRLAFAIATLEARRSC